VTLTPFQRRIAAAIHHYNTHGKQDSWTIPSQTGGSDMLGDELLDIFCKAGGISQDVLGDKRRLHWRNQLTAIVQDWQADADQAHKALVGLFDEKGDFGFKSYSSPFNHSFVADYGVMLGRVLTSGTTAGGKGDLAADLDMAEAKEKLDRQIEEWKELHGLT